MKYKITTAALALLFAIVAGSAGSARMFAGDISNDTIRQVLLRVSKHQESALADGDYAPVKGADGLTKARAPKGIAWLYPQGVALYGVTRASDFLDDKSGRDFVLKHNEIVAREYAFLSKIREKIDVESEGWKAFLRDRARCRIIGLMRLGDLDSCGAMAAQMLEMFLRQPECVTPEQRVVVERSANWIVNRQERLPDGTFWRRNSGDDDTKVWPRGTLWIDDTYMSGAFLVRWSQYKGNKKYLDDAAQQVVNMASRLQDANGVWFHAYNVALRQHSPVKWGRGNGWVLVTAVEVLSVMPENHPSRPKLLEIMRRHIEGLKSLQAENGMWRQILDDSASWEETSCTAMFAYAIARAVNRGWISPDNMAVARKAFAAVCEHVTPEGGVNGTCEGTGIGLTAAFYLNRKRPNNDLHGPGAVLFAGAEILAAKQ